MKIEVVYKREMLLWGVLVVNGTEEDFISTDDGEIGKKLAVEIAKDKSEEYGVQWGLIENGREYKN